jgi:hypothetical protein
MISISLEHNENEVSPIIEFDDIDLSYLDLATIIFFLKTGIYADLFCDMLSQSISKENWAKIYAHLVPMVAFHDTSVPDNIVEQAKIPVIKPDQSGNISND